MHYPIIDPIIVSLGPLALRWYGLTWLIGFAAVYLLGQWRINNRPDLLNARWDTERLSDLVGEAFGEGVEAAAAVNAASLRGTAAA